MVARRSASFVAALTVVAVAAHCDRSSRRGNAVDPPAEPAEPSPAASDSAASRLTDGAPSGPAVGDAGAASPAAADAAPTSPRGEDGGTSRRLPTDLGTPSKLTEREDRRVRSAIRRRVKARPTLERTFHFRRPDGSTSTIAMFRFSHVEVCLAGGEERQACVGTQGIGTPGHRFYECRGAGLARVDIGPPAGEAEGRVSAPTIRLLPEGAPGGSPEDPDNAAHLLCGIEPRALELRDVDGDGAAEIYFHYRWENWCSHEGESSPSVDCDLTELLVLRLDLAEQLSVGLTADHALDTGGYGARDFHSVWRFTDLNRDGRDDLSLEIDNWDADVCASGRPEPAREEECTLRRSRRRLLYVPADDLWRDPEDTARPESSRDAGP